MIIYVTILTVYTLWRNPPQKQWAWSDIFRSNLIWLVYVDSNKRMFNIGPNYVTEAYLLLQESIQQYIQPN
jgi:hypothetical protein